MVRVKIKKELKLAELIQHIIENNITGAEFRSQENGCLTVWDDGTISLNSGYSGSINPKSLFQITEEEEITEVTKIPLLLEVYVKRNNVDIDSNVWKNSTISSSKDMRSIAFYATQPDGTTTLLWTKEKGWVE